MSVLRCDRLWTEARLATFDPSLPGIGIIERGILASRNGKILFAGRYEAAPALRPDETINCEGRWITPGLIDPHTHLIYAGNRAPEFELRLLGASYEQIAKCGGGILSTMQATRDASEDALIASALPRLDALVAEGVTTIEIKSGYGLTTSDELKMLRAARRLADERPIRVVTTFLGAHAVPPEYADNAEEYVTVICEEMIPAVAAEGLADAVDAFCEGIGFTAAQTSRILIAARAHGLPVKLHAEQLSNLNGAAVAARNKALSADHLEHLDEAGIAEMAASGTVATLLPGAFYFMRETKLPPIAGLRAAGVPIALATDCNPGTSPLTSILLAMNMAATLFRMTVEECLTAITRNAAQALGLGHQIGSLQAGKVADFIIWDVESPAELVYRMGFNPLQRRVWGGR